jgi:hypothetical protein
MIDIRERLADCLPGVVRSNSSRDAATSDERCPSVFNLNARLRDPVGLAQRFLCRIILTVKLVTDCHAVYAIRACDRQGRGDLRARVVAKSLCLDTRRQVLPGRPILR